MRITFDCSTTETLEYLRIVNSIMRSNNVQAYKALKELVESIDNRLNAIEADNRRNKVCR